MFSKTKNKNKKYFYGCCLQCFSSEEILIEHKKDCLSINGKQNVRLKSGKTSSKNFHKQTSVPFKIYADFESILKKVKSDISESDSNSSYTKKFQDHIPCSFAYKVDCVDNKFSKKFRFYRGKNTASKPLSFILIEYEYCKKVVKNI